MEKDKIKVLVVEPGKAPYAKEIDSGLTALQNEVGGDIQALYPFEEPVALICDDEGKIKEKPLNRSLRDEQNNVYDVVAGTFLITGLGEENFVSLDSNLLERFTKQFETPEVFMLADNRMVVVPIRNSILKQLRQETPIRKAAPPKKKEPER